MTLQPGTRVKGIHNGETFTGTLREYNHISTIDLDVVRLDYAGRYSDTLYMYETIETCIEVNNSDRHYFVELLPEDEPTEFPLSIITQQSLNRQYNNVTRQQYRESVIRAKTTYKTVKKTVTCEYGCKHVIDTRVEVLPTISESDISTAYFFDCLARFAKYLEHCERQRQRDTESRQYRQRMRIK